MDFSGREIIAPVFFLLCFFWIYSMFTYQISAQMYAKFSLQLSSKAQNPKVVQHGDKCFWLMTLSVEHYSGKQPGSDPWPRHRCQHIHPHYTHVRHTAHSYRQTRRHTSNNEKKGCKLQYKAMWCIWSIFFPCLFYIVLCFPSNLWYILTKDKKCFVCTNIPINPCEAWFEFPLFWGQNWKEKNCLEFQRDLPKSK